MHEPMYIMTRNSDRPVLITIIKWYLQFHTMNTNSLYLKSGYGARSKSHFACFSHCCIMWCPLMTGIVTSQYPSSRYVEHMICYSIWVFNSLAPRRFLKKKTSYVIFKLILVTDEWGIFYEIALRWISMNPTDDKSTILQAMAWYRQPLPEPMLTQISVAIWRH